MNEKKTYQEFVNYLKGYKNLKVLIDEGFEETLNKINTIANEVKDVNSKNGERNCSDSKKNL